VLQLADRNSPSGVCAETEVDRGAPLRSSLPSPLDKVDKIYASMRQEIRRDGGLTWDVLCALCLRLMEPGGARAGGGTADDDGESPHLYAMPQLMSCGIGKYLSR